MNRPALLMAGLLLAGSVLPAAAVAQPADLPIAPATTAEYPPGVKVATAPTGPVYVDAKGRTLYGMDMRTLIRWSPDPAQHCQAECGELWEPLLAPAGATPNVAFPTSGSGSRATPPEGFVQPQRAPDWTVIAGPQGPQWVYKGWHMVFTRKGERPGAPEFDGADNLTWNTLKFVPPVPQLETPGNVTMVLVDGAYALADDRGRVLFSGNCAAGCAGWTPLAAGMASRGHGDWSVDRSGDVPQWRYRGRPVFVSQGDDTTAVPADGELLRVSGAAAKGSK